MRQCTIDKRQVRLPNASTLGYGKWTAQYGDLIVYKESTGVDGGYQLRTARVYGRVNAGPQGDQPAIVNHLYVLTLAESLGYAYVRWVDPADVTECNAITPDHAEFARVFLASDPPADLPDLVSYGVHADLTADQQWTCPTRIAARRQERGERGLAIDTAGRVPNFSY